MIEGVFALELQTKERMVRTMDNVSHERMNHFLIEFASRYQGGDGVIREESYNYVYHTSNNFCFGALATKEEQVHRVADFLRLLSKNSSKDFFDILFTIDTLLVGGVFVEVADIAAIKAMDSQDEKIYNMMMENKMAEKRRREKEIMKRSYRDEETRVEKPKPIVASRPTKPVEKSSKPVLIVIKERFKLVVDKEEYMKENVVSGEMNMVISDPEYKKVQLKVKGIRGDVKFSPYLDKSTISQGIFRFEKERGINKNIPMLKWSGKLAEVPLSFTYWSDEDNGKHIHVVEARARVSCQDVVVVFAKEGMTDIELSPGLSELSRGIEWRIGSLAKGNSVSCEIKSICFDTDGIFPISISMKRSEVETQMKVESVFLEKGPVDEFEVRYTSEAEGFTIVKE